MLLQVDTQNVVSQCEVKLSVLMHLNAIHADAVLLPSKSGSCITHMTVPNPPCMHLGHTRQDSVSVSVID